MTVPASLSVSERVVYDERTGLGGYSSIRVLKCFFAQARSFAVEFAQKPLVSKV